MLGISPARTSTLPILSHPRRNLVNIGIYLSLLKGPGDETTSKHPRFIERIDWELLRDQKKMIITMDTYHELTQAEEDAITGIIHLIDAIQDYAVDSMGKRNREVFNLPG